jgi:hypothetical protein
MSHLLTASAAVAMPAGGSNAAQVTVHPPRVSFSSQASNGIDAMLAVGIVLIAWAVALWSVSCLSHMAS